MEKDLSELLEQAPEVKQVQIIRVERGDILVLTAPGPISAETAIRLEEYFKRHFEADGLRCMVVADGLEVQKVLRPAKEPA